MVSDNYIWEEINKLSKKSLFKIICELDPFGRATELDIEYLTDYKTLLKGLSKADLMEELYQKVYFMDENKVYSEIEKFSALVYSENDN